MDKEFYRRLSLAVGAENVRVEEPMKKHTTFRIGGPADYFVLPHTAEELSAVIDLCKEQDTPWHIIGNGSNLLVGDRGVRGVVIQLFKNFSEIRMEDTALYAQAGAINSLLANRALAAGLTGYEFAAGIPGTIGGAVVMNAGAYGSEICDVLEEATVLDGRTVRTLQSGELKLGYRSSLIPEKGYIVLEAKLRLQHGEPQKIAARMEELRCRRVSKQPLEYPSAGSTFKRPKDHFAGKLIMDAGLAGCRVGGAQISEKHCGFVINTGNATAADVAELMEKVQETVYGKFQVRLEPEVKRLGDF